MSRNLHAGRKRLTPEECATIDDIAAEGTPEANKRAFDLLKKTAHNKSRKARGKPERD